MKTLSFGLRFLFLLLLGVTIANPSASGEVIPRGSIHFGPAEHTGRLQIQGNYLYFTPNNAELRILDISNRVQPVLVGRVQTRLGNESPVLYGTDIEINGDYAYVNCGLNVVVVNIADKGNPTIVTRFARPTQTMSLDLSDGVLYVGDSTSLGIYSLANPASPQLLGTYTTDAEVREVIVANRVAYSLLTTPAF